MLSRRFRNTFVLLAVASSSLVWAAPPLDGLPAPVYSFDRASLSLDGAFIDSCSVLRYDVPGPSHALLGPVLGLGPLDELDALSDTLIDSRSTFYLMFSVDRLTQGLTPPAPELVEMSVPYNAFEQALASQAAADQFLSTKAFRLEASLDSGIGEAVFNNTLIRNNFDEGGTDFAALPPTHACDPSIVEGQDRVDAMMLRRLHSAEPFERLFFSASGDSPGLLQLPGPESGASVFYVNESDLGVGACVNGSGVCAQAGPLTCMAMGGHWLGVGSSCLQEHGLQEHGLEEHSPSGSRRDGQPDSATHDTVAALPSVGPLSANASEAVGLLVMDSDAIASDVSTIEQAAADHGVSAAFLINGDDPTEVGNPPLRWSSLYPGDVVVLPTGQVGDPGVLALPSNPPFEWQAFFEGTVPQAELDQVMGVMALENWQLELLESHVCVAIVYDSDVGFNGGNGEGPGGDDDDGGSGDDDDEGWWGGDDDDDDDDGGDKGGDALQGGNLQGARYGALTFRVLSVLPPGSIPESQVGSSHMDLLVEILPPAVPTFAYTFPECGVACMGACCTPDGSCLITVIDNCDVLGGAYQGDGTVCDEQLCVDPAGACCFDDGWCSMLPEDACVISGGLFQGEATSCSTCPVAAVCCFQEGTCLELTEAACLEAEGLWLAGGWACEACPSVTDIGTCCLADNCDQVDPVWCVMSGGVWLAEMECHSCVAEATCCLPGSNCQLQTPLMCQTSGGVWMPLAGCEACVVPTAAPVHLYAGPADLGLLEQDDIDAMAIMDGNANGLFDGLDRVLFSLAPGSPSLTLLEGASVIGAAADVFVVGPGETPTCFAPAAELGLGAATDNIDALDIQRLRATDLSTLSQYGIRAGE